MRPLRLADSVTNGSAVLCRLSLLGVLAAFALAACSEDTKPEPAASGAASAAAAATTTTAAATTTTAAATTTVPIGALLAGIVDDTVWRDVLDFQALAQQQCILETLGDEAGGETDRVVLSDSDLLDGVASCIPERFVSLVVTEMEVETTGLSEEARSCLRALETELDWSAILGGAPAGILVEFLPALIGCVPELLLDDEAVPSDGDDHGDRNTGATPVALGEAAGASGVVDYGEDVDVFVFEAVAGEFYRIDVAPGTLSDSILTLYDAEGVELAHNDDYGATLASRLLWEAADSGPVYVWVGGFDGGTGTYTLTVAHDVDDHGNHGLGATPVALGEAAGVSGVIGSGEDVDVFRFEAVAGEFYQIDVRPGTLGYSILTLYDAEGVELGHNDGYRGTLASRLFWEAADSGPVYVWVGGWGGAPGTYTLTVVVLDFVDDHGDRNAEATPVALGEAIAGVLDYDEDVDVFRFEAVAGEFYQIGVWPGTVREPFVTLRDVDGLELAYDDGHAETPAVRLYWEATNSGPHYVAVGNPGTGPYTLIITER